MKITQVIIVFILHSFLMFDTIVKNVGESRLCELLQSLLFIYVKLYFDISVFTGGSHV